MDWNQLFQRISSPRIWMVCFLAMLLSACSEGEAASGSEAQNASISRAAASAFPEADPERGRILIGEYGCSACHTIPGIPAADHYVGPPLNDWAERRYIAGNLPNTPDNLVYWIRFPQAVEPGTAMPNLGVTEEDARHIGAYLYARTGDRAAGGVLSDIQRALRRLSGLDQPEAGSPPTSAGSTQADGEKGQTPGSQVGAQVYADICAECHGQNGEGGIGPALDGSAFVTQENPTSVIQTVLHGRNQMPAFAGQLSDSKIAAVITYIRNTWSNQASPVDARQVEGQRQ